MPTPRGKLIALIPEFARHEYALLHASMLYGDAKWTAGVSRELERSKHQIARHAGRADCGGRKPSTMVQAGFFLHLLVSLLANPTRLDGRC